MLKGKVAIVTGGTKGIGEGIANKFKKEGSKVVVSARTKIKTKHYFIKCDVSNSDEVKNLINETIKKYKRIDIVVNNAGIFPFIEFKSMTEEQWDEVMNVNLKGMYYITKAALPYLLKRKSGKIINIASIAGTKVGFPNLVHYCTTKAGVSGFTKSLALELAKSNIQVNAIAPGVIMTPGVKKGLDKKTIKNLLMTIPEGRGGKPSDIAATAAFLASEESQYITGQTIVVDGGYTDQ